MNHLQYDSRDDSSFPIWTSDNYLEQPPVFPAPDRESILQQEEVRCSLVPVRTTKSKIRHVSASCSEEITNLDPLFPAIISYGTTLPGWAFPALTPSALAEDFGDLLLELSGPLDNDGTPQITTCSDFLNHIWTPDEPLRCVFDGDVLNDCPKLDDLYREPCVPSLGFGHRPALLDSLPRHLQPQQRWLLIGPPGSGTCLHQDPDFTCAWNTVAYGCKRWAVLAPEAFSEYEGGDCSIETWFESIWPGLCKNNNAEGIPAFEFLQRPGDVVFVPAGWWHAVMNVELSVGITHNFIRQETLQRIVSSDCESHNNVVSDDMLAKVIDSLKLVDDEEEDDLDNQANNEATGIRGWLQGLVDSRILTFDNP